MPSYFDTGFSVRVPAWHRKTKVLEDNPRSYEEAREQAGLMWDVETEPIFTREGIEIGGWQRLTRNDTHDTLSVQPSSYAVIGNDEIGGVLDYVLEKVSKVTFETLGSVYNGRQIFATLLLDRPWEIGNGHIVLPYYNLVSRHDGSGGLSLTASSVAQVCANTIKASDMEGRALGSAFRIRHTSNWADRLADAKTALEVATSDLDKLHAMYRSAMDTPVTTKQIVDYLKTWLPISSDMTERQKNSVLKARETFKGLYDGKTLEGITGTWYGVLAASIEMCDHYTNSRNDDTEIRRVLIGPDPRKAKALALINWHLP